MKFTIPSHSFLRAELQNANVEVYIIPPPVLIRIRFHTITGSLRLERTLRSFVLLPKEDSFGIRPSCSGLDPVILKTPEDGKGTSSVGSLCHC